MFSRGGARHGSVGVAEVERESSRRRGGEEGMREARRSTVIDQCRGDA